MSIEEIFYNNQKIQYYELSTHTLVTENKQVTTYYTVEWHTLKGTFKDNITEEEYKELLKGLNNNA